MTDIGKNPEYSNRAGDAPASPLGDQDFWVASASGPGEQTLEWEPKEGNWRAVVMNTDASRGVASKLSIGAEHRSRTRRRSLDRHRGHRRRRPARCPGGTRHHRRRTPTRNHRHRLTLAQRQDARPAPLGANSYLSPSRLSHGRARTPGAEYPPHRRGDHRGPWSLGARGCRARLPCLSPHFAIHCVSRRA